MFAPTKGIRAIRDPAHPLRPASPKVRKLVRACKQLLSERGEASGVSLAQGTLALYAELSKEDQDDFFHALKTKFSPDPQMVLAAATLYAAFPDSLHLAALTHAAEPPRQELLRRLNRAPGVRA